MDCSQGNVYLIWYSKYMLKVTQAKWLFKRVKYTFKQNKWFIKQKPYHHLMFKQAKRLLSEDGSFIYMTKDF